MAEKRPFRQIASEWLLGGGALIALVTGAINFMDRSKDRLETRYRDACDRSQEAILDDSLNAVLDEAQARAFLAQQLNVARECAKDSGR